METYKYYIQPFFTHPLNQKRKIRSLLRFLKWQFILRIVNRNNAWLLVKHECGFRAIVKKGQTGMTGNLYSGLVEFEEMMFVIHYVRKEDIFFDVGANVGIYTLLASNLKKARTYCFEPIPSTFYFLRMNIAANNLENLVTCFNKGVGDEPTTLSFASDMDTMNKVANSEYGGNTIHAEVIRLDDFFEKISADEFCMIKIDTEGFEYNVLKGADSILSDTRVKVVLVEMNEAEKIHQLLSEKGFIAYTYDPVKRLLIEINYLSKANIIYINDLQFVQDRLRTADKFFIRGYEF